MNKKISLLLFALGLAIVMLGFQNCGVPNAFLAGTSSSSTDSKPTFSDKLAMDYSQTNSLSAVSCPLELALCEDAGSINDCLHKNVDAYYKALECKGYAVYKTSDCVFAISNEKPKAGEDVFVEATCSNVQHKAERAVHVGACRSDNIGFSEHPSTGMRLTAWLDLPSNASLVRSRAVVQYALDAKIQLANLSEGVQSEFQDACGKKRNVRFEADLSNVTISH